MDTNSLSIAMIPKAKKHLGQNFLRNPKILEKIVGGDSLDNTNVLEVGPGPGDLTAAILQQKPKTLSLIEIDDDMIPLLQARFANKNMFIYHGDVLSINIIPGEHTPPTGIVLKKDTTIPLSDYIVYGNIPYYITSPILQHFLYDVEKKPETIIFTMQKEVADRILIRDKQHSVLSLSCHLVATPIKICDISPENFVPVPKVWSTCLKFVLNKEDYKNSRAILSLIKLGFSQKRKKLISNLGQGYDKNILKNTFSELNISENTRAEELSLDEWKKLHKTLH
ncbi:ribosomal RNA small subunit methyltransferase A [Candidatus Gracilibacteria bacterium]|nr:ribosomal RNA small subunit methyltransferase A [Candidatus Gracilibacteria bacterium]